MMMVVIGPINLEIWVGEGEAAVLAK